MTAQMAERRNDTRDPHAHHSTGRHNRPEHHPAGRHGTPPGTPGHDEPERMPLRTDLFLISHCDDTGRPRLDRHAVSVGLAAAVLLELWCAGRVRLGWRGSPAHGTVTLVDASATADHINDSALALLWRLGGTVTTNRFINELAATNLYEQVRDHLTTTGILRRFRRRRFWFFRTEHRIPRSAVHPVKARARIRNVARLYQPRLKDTALAALVTALGLTPYLHFINESTGGVRIQLAEHLAPEHPIHDITKIITPHRLTFQ